VPYHQKLIGEKCYLSPCSDDDAERWAKWDNDLAVTLPLGDEAYTSLYILLWGTTCNVRVFRLCSLCLSETGG
jgi:hypothetical protein